MTGDSLFAYIERLQSDSPWGRFLDAGTGRTSLNWVCDLPTEQWTAVTGDPGRARALEKAFVAQRRPKDQIVVGNWTDPALLHRQAYETVLADYLLGALEGHSPYFQDQLFRRLHPHVGKRLYAVGLAPYPQTAPHPWGAALLDIVRLRDACILLAGDRTYREYPTDWVIRNLERSGFVVQDVHSLPIRYGPRFVNEQLDGAARTLPRISDAGLRQQLQRSIDAARDHALALHDKGGSQPFGEDWVIFAQPR